MCKWDKKPVTTVHYTSTTTNIVCIKLLTKIKQWPLLYISHSNTNYFYYLTIPDIEVQMQTHIQATLIVHCICLSGLHCIGLSGIRLLQCMSGNTKHQQHSHVLHISSFQTQPVKCYSLSFGERTVCFMSSMYGGDEATSSAGTVVSAGATSLHWQTAKASLLIYLKPQT